MQKSLDHSVNSESESLSVMSNSLRPQGRYSPWNSPGQNSGVGSCALLQGIFPTPRSNPDLPHCRRILYQLSHKGSPRILEWGAYPSSRGSSWPRVFCISGKFFTSWRVLTDLQWNITKPHNFKQKTYKHLYSDWMLVLEY